MDELLGITDLVVNEEEPEHEQGEDLVVNEEDTEHGTVANDITEWADLVEKAEQDAACGKQILPPILRSDLKLNGAENSNVEKLEPKEVRITEEDIEDEVNFWKPSIVGFVAGANPPLHVLEGFVRRIWKGIID